MLGSIDRMSPEGIGLYVAKQARKEAGSVFGLATNLARMHNGPYSP